MQSSAARLSQLSAKVVVGVGGERTHKGRVKVESVASRMKYGGTKIVKEKQGRKKKRKILQVTKSREGNETNPSEKSYRRTASAS